MHRRAGVKMHQRRTPEGPRGGLPAFRREGAPARVAEGLSVRGVEFLGRSVPAKPSRWVDGLKFGEVEIADCLQRIGDDAVLQVRRQRRQPGGILRL